MPTDFKRTEFNRMVHNNLNLARRRGDAMMVAYWKEMFV